MGLKFVKASGRQNNASQQSRSLVRTRTMISTLRVARRTGTRAFAACPITGHGGNVPNFINGQFVQSKTTEWIENLNPATQEVISMVPKSTAEEMQACIDGAKEAQKQWQKTPPQVRAR